MPPREQCTNAEILELFETLLGTGTAPCAPPTPSLAAEDSDDELGAMIYQSSRAAKASAGVDARKTAATMAAPAAPWPPPAPPHAADPVHEAGVRLAVDEQRRVRHAEKPKGDSFAVRPREGNDRRWDESFEQLKAFREANGDKFLGRDTKLGRWVDTQRTSRRDGRLGGERECKLNSIGFAWGKPRKKPQENLGWEARYLQLNVYHAANGHANVPSTGAGGLAALGRWCAEQRRAFRAGKLSGDRIGRLGGLGFRWDPSHGPRGDGRPVPVGWTSGWRSRNYREAPGEARKGRWSTAEHNLFLAAVSEHGRDWHKVVECVGTRSREQVMSHAQKYFEKVASREPKEEEKKGESETSKAGPNRKKEKVDEVKPAVSLDATTTTTLGGQLPLSNSAGRLDLASPLPHIWNSLVP